MLLTLIPYWTHTIARVWVMFQMVASVPLYGAEGADPFCRYEVIDAVETIEPLAPNSMDLS